MSQIYFYKGSENIVEKKDKQEDRLSAIKADIAKVLDTKSLSFLLGSGCSSFYQDDVEVGIPTMSALAKEFYDDTKGNDSLTKEEKSFLKQRLHIDVDAESLSRNLERFLETILSLNLFCCRVELPDEIDPANEIDSFLNDIRTQIPKIVKKTRLFILKRCLNEDSTLYVDEPLISLYERFYRTLLYRNPNLPKPNIFTTNYDLYNEKALDNLGILYANGFSGGISKFFNPTIFNYAYAEQLELSQNKWNIIDNFIYLYKIHGSVNWVEDDSNSNKLFKIKEIQTPTFTSLKDQETIMIFPTPTKQNASLGSPYSDLFREFQKKLMQNNNVLVTIGYSFGDEHINNLIYQAFTIPTFRLIVFAGNDIPAFERLKSLNDPRIWIIGGELDDKKNLHYFEQIVEHLLPDLSNDEIDDKIQNAIKTLILKNDE
jgi:hypothetical protein